MKNLLPVFLLCIVLLYAAFQAGGQERLKHPHGDSFSLECGLCHTAANWEVDPASIRFDHDQTGFPLIGVHGKTDCKECHQKLNFARIASHCADCHTDIHQGQLGVHCENCHSPQNWENRRDIWEEHNSTSFPLLGVHALVDCQACHVNQQRNEFATTPTECRACHLANYSSAGSPDHQKAQLGMQCEECHLPFALNWQKTTFQHTAAFVLDGSHKQTECVDCHQSVYRGTSSECFACHKTDYQATRNPNHQKFGFLTICQQCHNTSRWQGTVFNHVQSSGFELVGAHRNIDCLSCHINNQTSGLPRDCFGCHQQTYNSVADPNHLQNNFDHDCTSCHSTDTWTPATFDHNLTQFPLTGAHQTINCIDCHSNGYTATSTDCYSCHQADFNGVSDPNHVQNNFNHDCTLCHNTNAWEPSTFDHAQTQFPLTGSHQNVNCIDCHSSGYSGTPTDCYSCHQNDFTGVGDPNHVQNNFSHDCTLCHNTTAWQPATFDHNQTQFPLTGAHQNLQCVDCHSSGYSGTPTDCYSCHQNDFTGVSDPNHVQNNFSHDCTLCHSTTAWQPATFDHNQTQFPLTGAHLNLQCVDCHSSGYSGTPTDCFSCHQDDYNNTNNPDHQAAGFPTTCENCHNTSDWNQTTWDHDNQYFPIYSGKHQGEWTTCAAECHVVPGNYMVFECITCHEHNQQDMDNEHQGVQNYQYLSTACYNCHPNGEE